MRLNKPTRGAQPQISLFPEMKEPLIIGVPERGHVDVDFQTWKILASHPTIWKLIDQKILSVSQLSKTRMRLSGSCYVGRVSLEGLQLEFQEKVNGAVVALISDATHESFRIQQVSGVASKLGDLASLLIYHFLNGVKRYLSAGRNFCYEKKSEVGSLIGGRINVTGTIKIRARGLKHLVAFERNVLSRSTLKNRVVAAALREVERLGAIVQLQPKQIALARGLSSMFADCHDREVLFARRDLFVQHAMMLSDQSTDTVEKDLLLLSAVILAHQSFEAGSPAGGSVPRAWFLNLENLFQVATARVFEDHYAGGNRVVNGHASRVFIFDQERQLYSARPDIVLSNKISSTAVGDVKYKPWTAQPDASDLYQLLVHTRAFQASKCFLVYAHDRFEMKYLGISSTGAQTWAFAVDIRNLAHDVCAILKALELLPEAQKMAVGAEG
jgi:5-methylcytosine-specific restriction endonuclease McrBC regulatory subunit McrC